MNEENLSNTDKKTYLPYLVSRCIDMYQQIKKSSYVTVLLISVSVHPSTGGTSGGSLFTTGNRTPMDETISKQQKLRFRKN